MFYFDESDKRVVEVMVVGSGTVHGKAVVAIEFGGCVEWINPTMLSETREGVSRGKK